MKKIFVCILLLAFICPCVRSQNASTFLINGKITGQSNGKIFLYYKDNKGEQIKDSAAILKGTFLFKGNITEPTQAWLESKVKEQDKREANSTGLFLQPAKMSIELTVNDFRHAKIIGSSTQDEVAELEKSKAAIYQEMAPLEKEYAAGNEVYRKAVKNKMPEAALDSMKEKLAAMHDGFEPFQQRVAVIDYRFFAAHPNSYVTASSLRYYVNSLPLDSLEMFYNNMNLKMQQSSYGKDLAKEIKKLRSGSPGSIAADFATTDINGARLSLSEFKGKIVLVDFWASWCIPCRHSNPHLVELYHQYHDKGLDIIGVSDDDNDHDAWKKAVAKDKIDIWHHVLRGLDWDKINKGEDNPADISEKFGIHSLPTKILIDKNGVIVGRYDKGTDEEKEAMDKKIAEIIAN